MRELASDGLLRSSLVLVIWGDGVVSEGLLHNTHGVFRAALALMIGGNGANFEDFPSCCVRQDVEPLVSFEEDFVSIGCH